MKKAFSLVDGILTKPGWVFIFVVAFSIAYFIFAHEGFYWIDDYGYARYAWEVSKGTFSVFEDTVRVPNNPLTHRIMVFGPVALFYKIFGINIYAATVWPLLCTLGCSGIIYVLFRKENPKVAVFGMLLLGLYFHSLFLASYLYADNILMFFAFAAAAILYYFRFKMNGNKPVFFAGVFVIFNFLAFLTKETICYYLPFYFILALTDFFHKKHTVFWITVFIFGALLLSFYFSYYQFHTGDPFYRFHIIEQTNEDYKSAAAAETTKILFQRLTSGPIFFLIGSGIITNLIFAFGILINKRIPLKNWQNKPAFFWLFLAFSVLFFFWFGSTSLRAYNPITLLPRMCTILMPPLSLAAAFALQSLTEGNRRLAGFYTLLFGLVCLADRSNTLLMYLPLALFFGLIWWKLKGSDFKFPYGITVLVLICVLSLRPLHFMQKTSLMAFQEQDKIVRKYLNENTGNNLVLGDRWLQFMYDFHYKFEPNLHYQYALFLDRISFRNYDHIYLLVNRASLSNPDMVKWQTVQETTINNHFPQKKLIAQDGEVLLYKLK